MPATVTHTSQTRGSLSPRACAVNRGEGWGEGQRLCRKRALSGEYPFMDTPVIPPAKPKKRRRSGRLLLLLALLIISGYTVKRLFDSLSPFSDANKILASVPWRIHLHDDFYANTSLYTWLDNETIIYGLCDAKQNCRLMRQKVQGGNVVAAQPIASIPPLHSLYEIAVSPDGKWLMTMYSGKGGNTEYTIFDLDIGKVKQKYASNDSFGTWLNDSRSFLCSTYETTKIVQYEVDQHHTKSYSITERFGTYNTLSPSGEYFSNDDPASPQKPPQLERGSIFTGKSQVRAIPRFGSEEYYLVKSVSPQGDRLMWQQEGAEVSWMDKLMNRLTRRTVTPKGYVRWYVTGANGGSPRTLLKLDAEPGVMSFIKGSYDNPKWLPDGKHLSIVYKGALYVVDAP